MSADRAPTSEERTATAAPTGMLVAVNVAAAALGLVQAIVVARLLGPSALAVVAVLLAISSAVSNFLDVRLSDVAMHLYYTPIDDDDVTEYRQSVLQLCFVGTALLAVGTLVLGAGLGWALADRFVDQPVAAWWVLAAATTTAITVFTAPFHYLLRLTERFIALGAVRFASAAIVVAVTLTVLVTGDATLGRYFVALTAGTALGGVVPVAASIVLWRRAAGIDLLAPGAGRARSRYRGAVRLAASSSVYGYAKLLNRSVDVLLVGAIGNDVATGVYRLARQLTDGVYVLYDALMQVFLPRLLGLLSHGANAEFRSRARSITLAGSAFGAMCIAVAAVGIPVAQRTVLRDRYEGLTLTVVVLLVPVAFVFGMHLWIWPVLLHRGRVGAFASSAVLAALGQCAIVVVFGHHDPALVGAIAFASYYFLVYGSAWWYVRSRHPDLLPLSHAP